MDQKDQKKFFVPSIIPFELPQISTITRTVLAIDSQCVNKQS